MKHFKHSYSELAKVGKLYYDESSYCAVLATAVVCDLSFGKALSFSKKVDLYRKDITPKEEFEKTELLKYSKDYYRKKGVGRPTKKDRRDIEDYQNDTE